MSRRAKLIIAALFLVLVGIPVTHTVLTWHAVEPLRFRALRQELAPSKDFEPLHYVLRLKVQNTSATSVQLSSAWLLSKNWHGTIASPENTRSQIVANQSFGSGNLGMQEPVYIPPMSHWEGTAILIPLSREADITLPENVIVTYTYASRTRHRVLMWCHSLCKKLPASWRPRLPIPWDDASAPIESSS